MKKVKFEKYENELNSIKKFRNINFRSDWHFENWLYCLRQNYVKLLKTTSKKEAINIAWVIRTRIELLLTDDYNFCLDLLYQIESDKK